MGDNAPKAFEIEQHGIDIIPDQERHGTPREQFSVWFAGVIAFTGMIIGGIVGTLGLPIWAAIAVVLVGNLSFLFVGATGLAGPRAGTSTIVISRAPFGVFGNVLPAFFSWLTVVGWESVNAVLATLALAEVFTRIGLGGGTVVTLISLLLVVAVTLVIGVFGHATVLVAQKVFTWAIGILTLVLLVLVAPHLQVAHAAHVPLAGSSVVSTWFLALAIMMAGIGFSYTNYPADYTRYLAKNTPSRSVFWSIVLGGYIPATVLAIVGVLLSSTIDMTNPIGNLPKLLPAWFLIPFLLTAMVSLITNNVLNSYSSGLNLLALYIRIPRTRSVMIDGVLVLAASIYAIFFYNFINSFEAFLSLMVIWISAWTGVFLTDFWMRKGRYASEDLLRTGGGQYWYSGGIHWRGIAALLIGAVASFLFVNSTLWVSPLSAHLLGGADLSIPAGLVFGGVAYYALARQQVASAIGELSHSGD